MALGAALKENNSLESLILIHNRICSVDAVAIAEGLTTNESLPSNGKATPRNDSSLEELGVGRNEVDAPKLAGATCIQSLTNSNKTLKRLDLGRNYVGMDGATAIKNMLLGNQTLRFVCLGCHFIDDNGAIVIAEGLQGNATLEEIDLSENGIGTEGATYLKNMLATGNNKVLRRLDVSYSYHPTLKLVAR